MLHATQFNIICKNQESDEVGKSNSMLNISHYQFLSGILHPGNFRIYPFLGRIVGASKTMSLKLDKLTFKFSL